MDIHYKPARQFVEKALNSIPRTAIVLEIGAGKPFQKRLSSYARIFRHCDYKTMDIDPSVQPDYVADICQTGLSDNYADAIICFAVLEHVPNPLQAAKEIRRILKSGGLFLGIVPFLHKYHGNEHYRDYFRFTKDGIKLLFREFKELKIVEAEGYLAAALCSLPVPCPRWVFVAAEKLDNIIGHSDRQAGRYYICARK